MPATKAISAECFFWPNSVCLICHAAVTKYANAQKVPGGAFILAESHTKDDFLNGVDKSVRKSHFVSVQFLTWTFTLLHISVVILCDGVNFVNVKLHF